MDLVLPCEVIRDEFPIGKYRHHENIDIIMSKVGEVLIFKLFKHI